MFQSLPSSQQQSQYSTQQLSSNHSSATNDERGGAAGTFWSPPAPSLSSVQQQQQISILQRPTASNLPPQSIPMNVPALAGAIVPAGGGDFAGDYAQIFEWVSQLLKGPEGREKALLELSRKREQYDDLALILWHSFGVMTTLLQEIISVYPLLSPPELTPHASNRVCNALALLQCVASHPETRDVFLKAHIPLFLYPFLNTTSKSRPFEYLRLTSLGVIGALVKSDSPPTIEFLLSTEIIPLCLRIMETGSELSKTVAIFILQKILLDDAGLQYICGTYERFLAVAQVLNVMVNVLVEMQAVRLLKHVVRCYLRLSDHPKAREALKTCLPDPLRNASFATVLKDDTSTKRCLAQLLFNLSDQMGASGDT